MEQHGPDRSSGLLARRLGRHNVETAAINPPITRIAAIFPLICSPELNLAGETLAGPYDSDVKAP